MSNDLMEHAMSAVNELVSYDERPMRLEAIAVLVGRAGALMEAALKAKENSNG